MEVLATAIREGKEIKGIQIRNEEVKVSLFADDMMLYSESPKDATRKLLELINELGNVAGDKVKAHKSLSFLYTNDEKSEREIKETLPFTISTKRIKYLGINLSKDTKDLYAENYKTLERYTMFLDWKNQHCENDYTTQSNLQIQCNPCQTTNGIFHRTRTKNFIICMETQKTLNSQSNHEKEKLS